MFSQILSQQYYYVYIYCMYYRSPGHDSTAIDQASVNAYHDEVSALDIHSEDFNILPPEVQHELLLERQQLEKHGCV